LNFAIQKEIRKARRAQYAENQRLEKEGLDVPVTGLKVSFLSLLSPSFLLTHSRSVSTASR